MALTEIQNYEEMRQILSGVAQRGGFDNPEGIITRLTRDQGMGDKYSIFSDTLFGYNKRIQGNIAPANTDLQGLTFFTRPNLNLSYDNVAQIRSLTPLLSSEINTYQRAVRVMLDVDGARLGSVRAETLFDHQQAFLPLLTNTITSISGWPDILLNAYSTPEGMMKESWMMNDSISSINGRFDLSCTFQNMLGDPISLIFYSWLTYMGAVYTGKMVPFPYCLVENEIDYMTRIYRLVLDHSGRFVQKIACCGVAMPVSLGIGSSFNYNRESLYNEDLHQITVNFACLGAWYNDPIIIEEFNRSVSSRYFNPGMADGDRTKNFVQVPHAERMLFNYRGYPWIGSNNELQWWLPREEYESIRKGNIASNTTTNAAAAAA